MALPTSRDTLIKWCLQKLGQPVIKINVEESQLENACDEALELFKEYHVDGTAEYVKAYELTGSTLEVLADPVIEFRDNEEIKGATSGAVGKLVSYDSATKKVTFVYKDPTDPIQFVDGEIVVGVSSTASVTLIAADALVLGNIDKRYIELSDQVVGIIEILKSRNSHAGNGKSVNPFDFQYQVAQQFNTFVNSDIVTYYMFQQDIAMWDQIFTGKMPYWHARKQNRLYLQVSWTEKFAVGSYLVVKFWSHINPTEFPKVYADKWLRKYLTALIEVQWGQNLTKYREVTLPGGLVMNGEQIEARAAIRLKEAHEELRSTYEQKVGFRFG